MKRHQEQYCRYRQGKKARKPAVDCQLTTAVIDDDEEFRSDTVTVKRTQCAVNGHARTYEMVPRGVVHDAERWLIDNESMVSCVHDALSEFLVKGHMVLKARFVKRNPATGVVLQRDEFYMSSLSADVVYDFEQWYSRHTIAIINNFEAFCRRDSSLELECVESLIINFNLFPNLSGRGSFQLPQKLKNMNAVINVNCKDSCFKYALLSL